MCQLRNRQAPPIKSISACPPPPTGSGGHFEFPVRLFRSEVGGGGRQYAGRFNSHFPSAGRKLHNTNSGGYQI